MRALLLLALLCGIATAQFGQNQGLGFGPGFQSGSLDSSPGSNTPTGPRGCFCLPGNQLCKPNGPIPVGATRISNIKVRIINLNPLSNCPQGQSECCFGSGGPIPKPPTLPAPITGCGARRSLIPGRTATDDADFGEYPWMTAVLEQSDKFVAGGVLVAPHWVLTAAHKVLSPGILKVRVGDYNLAEANEVPEFPHQEVPVSQVIFHPRFNPSNLQNDVALLRLQRPVKFNSHINTACLPEKFQSFAGQRCYVTGWGTNIKGQFQPILKEVDLPIVDEFACEESLRRTRLGPNFVLDMDSFLCAGGEAGKDACGGDGGAPLVCDEKGVFTVVGLVAWGIGCGQDQVPGVYVNIATFSDFINSHIHNN